MATSVDTPVRRACLRGSRASRFQAIQHALIPSSARFDAAERHRSLDVVERTLAAQPPVLCQQLAFLLFAIDLGCFLRYGHGLRRLSVEHRLNAMEFLARNRFVRLRLGAEGLTTLAKLGAYGLSESHPALGYRPRENP